MAKQYIYFGHGLDMFYSDRIRNKVVFDDQASLATVPESSMYVNLATCGASAMLNFRKLITHIQEGHDTFQDPIKNKKDIEGLLNNDTFSSEISVYVPNPRTNSEKFVNNLFSPFAIFKSGANDFIFETKHFLQSFPIRFVF